MKPDDFYPLVHLFFMLPPEQRYRGMLNLHEQIRAEYCQAVERIGPERAAQTGADGRSILQMVGHIAEWDRWMVTAAGEMLAGAPSPQIMRMHGYLDSSGEVLNFADVDTFNAAVAEKQSGARWEEIQPLALRMSEVLYTLFTHPLLLNPAVLEQGAPEEVRFPTGKSITVPVGWALWYLTLEHEGVEHAADLGIGA